MRWIKNGEITDDENPVADKEEEGTQHGSVASVRAAKAAAFRHAALGPEGAPPVPDPRLLEWAIPETCKPERRVCLAYSTNKDVRLTYLAQAWREPHWSITGRFTGPVTGTPPVNFLLADLLPTLLAKKITAPLLACQ